MDKDDISYEIKNYINISEINNSFEPNRTPD
jgi:hypothetical protein